VSEAESIGPPARKRSAPGLAVAGTEMNLRLASHYHLLRLLQAQFELPSARLNSAKAGPPLAANRQNRSSEDPE
jgi:hypothetical protein